MFCSVCKEPTAEMWCEGCKADVMVGLLKRLEHNKVAKLEQAKQQMIRHSLARTPNYRW